MSKRRDPFGGNVVKSNSLPQRAVYNETLNRLFATPTNRPSSGALAATPSIVSQHEQQQHRSDSSVALAHRDVYDAQCYVCMSHRPALECVSCARCTCEQCARQCVRCAHFACALCSQVSYAARYEQNLCFDCFRVESIARPLSMVSHHD
jgi:hypothetical protein